VRLFEEKTYPTLKVHQSKALGLEKSGKYEGLLPHNIPRSGCEVFPGARTKIP
jgi:hypothetical protein